MSWLDRLTRRWRKEHAAREAWRKVWHDATLAPTAAQAAELRSRLNALAGGHTDDDAYEIEREMLDALDDVVALASEAETRGIPVIQTGHRAAGTDPCHFSAPASLPDDPAQPGGTLLLTRTRLVFVGGSRAVTLPWHRVGRCLLQDRDLIIGRTDGQALQRVRCNTFSDALRAAFLVRYLTSARHV